MYWFCTHIERLAPALGEVEAALGAVDTLRDGIGGTLRLNVPVSAARLVLPAILPGFLAACPGIRVEIAVEDRFVDVLASGCDAGIRYDERLEQDMIAIPIARACNASRRRRRPPISTVTGAPPTHATCSAMPASSAVSPAVG